MLLTAWGGMAKSACDLAALTKMLFLTIPEAQLSGVDLTEHFRTDFAGLTLGFANIDAWQLPASSVEPDNNYLTQRVRIIYPCRP